MPKTNRKSRRSARKVAKKVAKRVKRTGMISPELEAILNNIMVRLERVDPQYKVEEPNESEEDLEEVEIDESDHETEEDLEDVEEVEEAPKKIVKRTSKRSKVLTKLERAIQTLIAAGVDEDSLQLCIAKEYPEGYFNCDFCGEKIQMLTGASGRHYAVDKSGDGHHCLDLTDPEGKEIYSAAKCIAGFRADRSARWNLSGMHGLTPNKKLPTILHRMIPKGGVVLEKHKPQYWSDWIAVSQKTWKVWALKRAKVLNLKTVQKSDKAVKVTTPTEETGMMALLKKMNNRILELADRTKGLKPIKKQRAA